MTALAPPRPAHRPRTVRAPRLRRTSHLAAAAPGDAPPQPAHLPGHLPGRGGRPPRRAWTGRGRWPRAAVTAAALLTLGGCAFGPPPAQESGRTPNLPPISSSPMPEDLSSTVTTDVLAQGLSAPWGMAFLPDGTVLITERDSHQILRGVPAQGAGPGPSAPAGPSAPSNDPGGAGRASALTVTPVQTLADAVSRNGSGLLGIAVSPTYATDQSVFVYYTTATDARIARLTLGGAPQPVLTGIPLASARHGGGLAFGPDRLLYASTGTPDDSGLAQNPASLAGKILRMTPEGRPAPGNPFGTLVYSYGHRNVRGFAWSQKGTMFAVDSGEQTVDEVNVIEAGRDYGWPAGEGNISDPKYTNPAATWAVADGDCTGVAVGPGLMLTSCAAGQRLWLLQLTEADVALGAPKSMLTKAHGRLRGAVTAPDGSIWVSTSNKDGQGTPKAEDDKILRISLGTDAESRT